MVLEPGPWAHIPLSCATCSLRVISSELPRCASCCGLLMGEGVLVDPIITGLVRGLNEPIVKELKTVPGM